MGPWRRRTPARGSPTGWPPSPGSFHAGPGQATSCRAACRPVRARVQPRPGRQQPRLGATAALAGAQSHSLPLGALADPQVSRPALDTLTLRLGGTRVAAATHYPTAPVGACGGGFTDPRRYAFGQGIRTAQRWLGAYAGRAGRSEVQVQFLPPALCAARACLRSRGVAPAAQWRCGGRLWPRSRRARRARPAVAMALARSRRERRATAGCAAPDYLSATSPASLGGFCRTRSER
jgi:hypothetical protein